jgi:uncharacterized protein YecE (DUF72 family)
MDLLGDKLGPLLLQLPYFNKQAFPQALDFLARLSKFLNQLPRGRAYSVELRNKYWLNDRLLDLLRQRNISLVLLDDPWMTPVDQLIAKHDVVTADFAYIRWLGDRKGIEEKIKHWDKVIIDRTHEMETWVPIIRKLLKRGIRILGFFNNHYAGFAPDSIKLFHEVWERMGAAEKQGFKGATLVLSPPLGRVPSRAALFQLILLRRYFNGRRNRLSVADHSCLKSKQDG